MGANLVPTSTLSPPPVTLSMALPLSPAGMGERRGWAGSENRALTACLWAGRAAGPAWVALVT